ncbi:MAG: hypothetical protein HYS04_01655, partial [Acidobacteria bacterium]|nr:hypothetical protein [Acidobacteriota bacterium]
MSRRARYALIGGGVIVALLLIAVTAALILLPSQWFRDKMRHRLVYELERVTGGEVEIGSFQFDWRKLQASVQPFVLHGTEPAGERPLFRAQSLQLTLKLVSALKRDVDIHALVVDQPEVNILVNENGITNFPTPKIKRERTKDPVEQLLDLAVREFTVRNGYVRYADKKVAVEMRGRNLNARLAYDFTGPRYVGEIKFTDLGLDSARTLPMHLTYDSKVALERNRLVVENARLAMKRSSIVLRGEITNFADPHARFDTRIMGNLAELGKPLKISQPESGEVTINGALTYSAGESYQFTGKMRGQEVVVRSGRLRIPAIKVISDLRIGPKDLQLRGVQVSALDGAFRGSADIQEFNRFKINGQVEGISLRTLSRLQGLRTAA